MATIHEALSAQFQAWERQGRGLALLPYPVRPEPCFRPFAGYSLPPGFAVDDGRRPTVMSSLFRKLSEAWNQDENSPVLEAAEEDEVPEPFHREELMTLRLAFPASLKTRPEDFSSVLAQLADTHEPVAFEVVGGMDGITLQIAAEPDDARMMSRRMLAHFPDLIVTEGNDALANQWCSTDEAETFVVEFGLSRGFVLPLATDAPDIFLSLLSSLTDLATGECGVFQILFQPVNHPWAEHALRAVTDPAGEPMFVNAPELSERVQEKIQAPLFAVVVRLAAQAEHFDRTVAIVRDMAVSLRGVARLDGNELVPLSNEEYSYDAHAEDVVKRQCRRHGLLLNTDELAAFVHLPSVESRRAGRLPDPVKSKRAPRTAEAGLHLGMNLHAGESTPVHLSREARLRHTHIIGASGSGKSTLLLHLIQQDIENGEGVAVLDPHGDLIESILGLIPEHRLEDVILLNPADETHAVGFNILCAHSELEKTLLASDLVSVFERLSTSWGDQMNSVLRNAIMAFLESREGGTLTELRRFLVEPEFRKQFLQTVEDSEVLYYWQKGFAQLTGNKSIGPIVTRLDGFLAPKPIRHLVSQRENRLDFADMMDHGKIFLARLAQGEMGRENTFLLGSLLVGKFHETAMSRQGQAVSARRPFWLYVDEFQNFITPSMAEILSGTRKYGLGLILAHQELRQLERDREVASAVLTHAHARVCFRLGDEDARKLADGFAGFDARDLQSLPPGQAIARLESPQADFNLSVPMRPKPDPDLAAALRERVVTRSREKYARLRTEVEAELRERLKVRTDPAPRPVQVPPKSEPPPEAPPAPELPKEPTPPTPVAPVAEAPKQPSAPRDLGRGGDEHKSIQKRLKEEGEKLGFRSSIEKTLSDGRSGVDLLLERDGTALAVEITITTTIGHELENIIKCLQAGFKQVAVVASQEKRLKDIEAAVVGTLAKEDAARVGYFTPDALLNHLRSLPITSRKPLPPTESVVHGIRVRRHLPKLSPEEQKLREGTAVKMLSETMGKRAG